MAEIHHDACRFVFLATLCLGNDHVYLVIDVLFRSDTIEFLLVGRNGNSSSQTLSRRTECIESQGASVCWPVVRRIGCEVFSYSCIACISEVISVICIYRSCKEAVEVIGVVQARSFCGCSPEIDCMPIVDNLCGVLCA